MKRVGAHAWRQAASCLLCAIVGFTFSAPLGPSEFSGGSVTGPLLTLHDVSGYLFLLAVLLTFLYPRIAAATAMAAALLSLPLYFYFIAPGPFRWLFPGEYSGAELTSFVWNTWAPSLPSVSLDV